MLRITLDFETYWDNECTLSKLSVWEYIRHPSFKIHMCGVMFGDAPVEIYTHEELKSLFAEIDWSNAAVCGHNLSGFDGIILNEVYGVVPGLYVDTKDMAVYDSPREKSHSLNACAERYLDSEKIQGVLIQSKGVKDIKPGTKLFKDMAKYCARDVELTAQLAKVLVPKVPPHERQLIHLTAKMNATPVLHINKEEVGGVTKGILSERKEVLEKLNMEDEKDITSLKKFAKLLQKEGVHVPYKYSKVQDKMIPALSKDDNTLPVIAEQGNERVKLLVRARELFSSNLALTRLHRWLVASEQGTKPISFPLIYHGAKNTGRWSGAAKLNGQNIPREGGLRECIFAPPGCKFIIADYSAIEMRMCAYLAGEQRILSAYKAGRDIYCEVGTDILGVKVTKETKRERFISKVICLAGIYGAGPPRIKHVLAKSGIILTDDEAVRAVYRFRDAVPRIRELWNRLDKLCRRGFLVLPSGRKITYPDLHVNKEGDLVFWNGKFHEKLYGAKCTEGCSQASARDVFAAHWVQMDIEGIQVAMGVHDEFVVVEKEDRVEETKALMEAIMVTPPPFCDGLPLGCEITVSEYYTK